MREFKSEMMKVHSSRAKYFANLRRDPYGFKNPTYNWEGENKFVLISSFFYLSGIILFLLWEQYYNVQYITKTVFFVFLFAVFIEVLGKIIFAYVIQKYHVKINYIRKLAIRPWRKLKIYVISIFFVLGGMGTIPVILMLFFLDQMKTILTEWNVIRRRVPILAYAFVSWDRLEDRPYTLRYDMMEDLLRFLVYFPFIVLFGKASIIIMIPNLINEFGDGLAEPVGIRFGKHKYRAKALWHNGKFWNGDFQRSLEGSAMVFLVSIIVLIAYHALFTTNQLIILLLFLPILMTLAEAYSPHTNDGPLLALVGCSFLWMVTQYV